MQPMIATPGLNIDEAVETLSNGDGYLLLEGFYSPELVRQARERTYELAAAEPRPQLALPRRRA